MIIPKYKLIFFKPRGVWGCQETGTNRRVPKARGGNAVAPGIPAIHPPVTDLSSTVWVPAVPGRWWK